MKRFAALQFIVLLALFLLPVTSSAKEGWMRVQTRNFTIIGNAGESTIEKLATKLEQFRYVLSLIFPKAQIDTKLPTTVFLFKSHSSFKPFKPQYKGKTRETVAGYFLASADGNYIALTAETGGDSPYDVIFHEYEHFVIQKNVPNAPVWLDEGMAEFFSSFTTSDDLDKATVGSPIARHVLTLSGGKFLSFDTLLTVNRKSSNYNESDKAGIFYAESWALVHYLMMANGRQRQSQITKFISGLNAGTPLADNFRQSFQADYKSMERELRSYMSKFTFPVLNVTFTKQADWAKVVQRSPMPEAEVQAYLGDLLLRNKRFEEAETYLQKSLELDPNFGTARVSLGILRIGQGRLPEAKKLLESALAVDSQNYRGYLYYARMLLWERSYEDAIKSYKQAIQLKPELAQPYFDLGYVYLNLGKEEEAVKAFKQAVDLDPLNPYLYRNRSYAYLRLRRASAAASDAIVYLRRQGWQDDHSAYMALAAYFALIQSGQTTPAAKILNEASTALSGSEWPYPVIRFLQHKIDAEGLLALATDNDKLTEAHAYVGLSLSLIDLPDQALTHLYWVRDNGNKNFIEYSLALAEIAHIEAKAHSTTQ